MVIYIQHIIWRFVKHKPDQYRLLDVRHNIMKNLILGDCDHLIKFILFGDEENKDKNSNNEKEKEQVIKLMVSEGDGNEKVGKEKRENLENFIKSFLLGD